MSQLLHWLEPKNNIEAHQKRFDNKYLIGLIVPLLIEQFLVMLVGIADTLMVSYAGESAVSGVSLVNMFVTIFIYVFVALASGGAVVVSQYLGKKDKELGDLAAAQVLNITLIVSMVFTLLTLIFNHQILSFLFGKVEVDVMQASVRYLTITTLSFPFLALYNTGASLFRSMGKTRITMYISLGMNIINIVGNYIGIFILKAGVAGVAWPTFASRVFAAVVIITLAFSSKNSVQLHFKNLWLLNKDMIRRTLKIAIPNGIEQGLFQVSKVILSSITALFGTTQIAANGVAQSFWSMSALFVFAMNPAFVTIIGQSIGANEVEAAKYYMRKLLRITHLGAFVWNGIILALLPFILNLYVLSIETKSLIIILVIIHNAFNFTAAPLGFGVASGMRAAGDVKFVMYVSLFATVVVRVALSYILGIFFNLGVIGIALAMVIDWCVRAVLIEIRFRRNEWFHTKVI